MARDSDRGIAGTVGTVYKAGRCMAKVYSKQALNRSDTITVPIMAFRRSAASKAPISTVKILLGEGQ